MGSSHPKQIWSLSGRSYSVKKFSLERNWKELSARKQLKRSNLPKSSDCTTNMVKVFGANFFPLLLHIRLHDVDAHVRLEKKGKTLRWIRKFNKILRIFGLQYILQLTRHLPLAGTLSKAILHPAMKLLENRTLVVNWFCLSVEQFVWGCPVDDAVKLWPKSLLRRRG